MAANRKYRSKAVEWKTFFTVYFIVLILVYILIGVREDRLADSLFFALPIGFTTYLFFGWTISYFFQKAEDNKKQKKTEHDDHYYEPECRHDWVYVKRNAQDIKDGIIRQRCTRCGNVKW